MTANTALVQEVFEAGCFVLRAPLEYSDPVQCKQFSMQATTVATVNATYDRVAAEANGVMREVLGVRAKEQRHTVTPPVARARPADAFDNSYGVGDSGEHRERVAA